MVYDNNLSFFLSFFFSQLLAPNLVQKHFLQSGAEQIAAPVSYYCYYCVDGYFECTAVIII